MGSKTAVRHLFCPWPSLPLQNGIIKSKAESAAEPGDLSQPRGLGQEDCCEFKTLSRGGVASCSYKEMGEPFLRVLSKNSGTQTVLGRAGQDGWRGPVLSVTPKPETDSLLFSSA